MADEIVVRAGAINRTMRSPKRTVQPDMHLFTAANGRASNQIINLRDHRAFVVKQSVAEPKRCLKQ